MLRTYSEPRLGVRREAEEPFGAMQFAAAEGAELVVPLDDALEVVEARRALEVLVVPIPGRADAPRGA